MASPTARFVPPTTPRIAATPKEGVIVAIEVTDRRNDAGLAGPMVATTSRFPPLRQGPDGTAHRHKLRHEQKTSLRPGRIMRRGACRASTPPPPRERDDVKPATLARRIRKREKEPVCLKEWRERIASEAGKLSMLCASASGGSNADRKNHGFGFSSSSRSHQSEIPRALARHRQQSHGRPTLEGQCPSARSLRGRAAPKEQLARTEDSSRRYPAIHP